MNASTLPYRQPDVPTPPRNLRRRQNVAFVVVGAILLTASLGLNLGVQRMGLVFRKEAVDPVLPVAAIGTNLNGWQQVGNDRKIDSAIEETLGTDRYVFRTYINYNALTDAERATLDELPADRKEQYAYHLMMLPEPKAISFSFTYYTGLIDSVPHIPERCFVAGGFEPVGSSYLTWAGVLPSQDLQVRYIDFQEQASSGLQSHTRNVAYFFSVNGQWLGNVESVRHELQDLTSTKSYFAKVELMTMTPNPAAAQGAMQAFLRDAIPSIETVLPIAVFQDPSADALSADALSADAPAAPSHTTNDSTKVETL